jgi:hypothetical protein
LYLGSIHRFDLKQPPSLRRLYRCSGYFAQFVPLPVVCFGPFRQKEPVVALGVGFDERERKNKTVFRGIVG